MHTHETVVFGLVALIALGASTVSGITGFGGAVLMLPVLVYAYGLRDAVVVLTITQAVGNGSRAWFGRTDIDWSVAWRFIAGAIPSAILGSVAFAKLTVDWLSALLGIFLLLTVLYRHTRLNQARMPLNGFVPLGLVFGFLSAVLGSVGPFVAPWFLAYGLVKTAYVSTEALGALAMHLTKTVTYGNLSLLTGRTIVLGLALSPAMIAGSYLGKRLVGSMPENVFHYLIEAVLIVAGIQFLIEGLFHVP
jgi:uncharacterized protein